MEDTYLRTELYLVRRRFSQVRLRNGDGFRSALGTVFQSANGQLVVSKREVVHVVLATFPMCVCVCLQRLRCADCLLESRGGGIGL